MEIECFFFFIHLVKECNIETEYNTANIALCLTNQIADIWHVSDNNINSNNNHNKGSNNKKNYIKDKGGSNRC